MCGPSRLRVEPPVLRATPPPARGTGRLHREDDSPPGSRDDLAHAAQCFICGLGMSTSLRNPNLVCHLYDHGATAVDGTPLDGRWCEVSDGPWGSETRDGVLMIYNLDGAGANPVVIDGMQCWRLHRFGGWVTMAEDETRYDRSADGRHPRSAPPDRRLVPASPGGARASRCVVRPATRARGRDRPSSSPSRARGPPRSWGSVEWNPGRGPDTPAAR